MKRLSAFMVCGVLFAQQPPVVAHRQLPTPQDLRQAQAILAGDSAVQPSEIPTPELQAKPAQTVPRNFRPKRELVLDVPARTAAMESEQQRSESTGMQKVADGSVSFVYGRGVPEIVCSPYHLCTIQLQVGEKLTGKPVVSDSASWTYFPGTFGSGESVQQFVAFKPRAANVEADLILTTDRRAYSLRLLSKASEYVSRITFSYPEDEEKRWGEFQTQMTSMSLAPLSTEDLFGHADAPRQSNDPCSDPRATKGYRIKSKHYAVTPERVCDNGTFVYITMPDIVRKTSGPAPMLRDGRKLKPLNYHVQGSTFVIHRLFARVDLISGTGRHKSVVSILGPREP